MTNLVSSFCQYILNINNAQVIIELMSVLHAICENLTFFIDWYLKLTVD